MQPNTWRITIGELDACSFERLPKVFQCSVVRHPCTTLEVRDRFGRNFACIGELLLGPIEKGSRRTALDR